MGVGRGVLAVLVAAGVAVVGVVAVSAVSDDDETSSRSVLVTRVIDGDTVEITSGRRVRLIGLDTPETGSCGFEAATRAMRRLVEGVEVTMVNPVSVQDTDAYGRLLRYVDVAGRDAGLEQIAAGRAVARYDSRDGYDAHPREGRYRRSDAANDGPCEQR